MTNAHADVTIDPADALIADLTNLWDVARDKANAALTYSREQYAAGVYHETAVQARHLIDSLTPRYPGNRAHVRGDAVAARHYARTRLTDTAHKVKDTATPSEGYTEQCDKAIAAVEVLCDLAGLIDPTRTWTAQIIPLDAADTMPMWEVMDVATRAEAVAAATAVLASMGDRVDTDGVTIIDRDSTPVAQLHIEDVAA